MKMQSFIIRFLIFFIPLAIFMFIMTWIGITKNVFLTILLSLAFVWMIQAIYNIVLNRKS